MSAEPVWCLFRVHPDEASNIQEAFETALGKSKIPSTLQQYLDRRRRHANLLGKHLDDFPFLGNSQGVELFDYLDDAYLFLDELGDLFFLRGANELILTLGWMDSQTPDSTIEMVITHRIAATQMLYGALGWQKAKQLPGSFGNMFIPPQDVAEALTCVETIMNEVDEEEFLERACAFGDRGISNDFAAEKLLSLLPYSLKLVLEEGNGFAAISYPHVGSLSADEEDNYWDEDDDDEEDDY